MKVYVFAAEDRAPRLENLGGNSSNPMNDILAKSAQQAEENRYRRVEKFQEIRERMRAKRNQDQEIKDEIEYLRKRQNYFRKMGLTEDGESLNADYNAQGYAPTYQTPQAYTPMYAQPYPQQYGMM